MPFDPDDYSALARKLFDPSGWKERVYGDPTVRVLILLRPEPTYPSFAARALAQRPGELVAIPRPVSEVADAVLAYRERLLAFSVPDDPELWRAADHVVRIARQLPFPTKLSLA